MYVWEGGTLCREQPDIEIKKNRKGGNRKQDNVPKSLNNSKLATLLPGLPLNIRISVGSSIKNRAGKGKLPARNSE